ncbi:DUF2325 domain-containing protein [Mammaliicoccus sciuri]|uniref:DUF2325 domain-containing protein n=1 Tax=Mammaliicoccus sciuri TaxID=1296 RepID=UPI002884B4C2|nr:DUF2325 domain-containing protein [Mammaliicoccus sciuri]MDT0746165.1 DUF2325 domain-containing protein [Mammaliicoccus sciuri]MDT0753476.1 DUF2325 domain-containing protein [Mammaliicoccus sciuri]
MKRQIKEEISHSLKESWIADIENIKDLDVLETETQKYLNMLKTLSEMYDHEDDQLEPVKNDEPKREIEDDDIYIFSRKLSGGMGLDRKHEEVIYVPEKIVRQLDLQHGDVIRCEQNVLKGGKTYFEKLEGQTKLTEIEESSIIDYDYIVVNYDETLKQYVCNEQYGDDGLVNIPAWLIHHDDVNKFNLNKGDVVSAARMTDRNILRIRWKYNTDEILPTPKPKKPTEYKEKKSSDVIVKSADFEGFNIGIFGTEKFICNYINEVEKRGGHVIHTDSDVRSQIERVVDRSDIIVIPILQTSHIKAELAKEGAKRSGKPFVILKTNGKTNFIRQIFDCIEEHNLICEVN